MSKTAIIISGIFIGMVSFRSIMSLCVPGIHKKLASRFYRQGGRGKYLYLVLFILASTLLILETSITGFILALMAIGFLYDYFLALFPEESEKIVQKGQKERKRMWFFGYVVPLGSLAWFTIALFIN